MSDETTKPPPKRRGRKKMLPSAEQTKTILDTLMATGSDVDAYTLAGVPHSTFYQWLDEGRQDREKGKQTPLLEFSDKVKKAKSGRTVSLVASIRKAGMDPKHWTANAWLLERTDPKRYGQRVRVHVQEELTDAVARLRDAFKDDPTGYEKALTALSGGHSAGGAEPDSEGEGGEDARGSEALSPSLPKPEAVDLPLADV